MSNAPGAAVDLRSPKIDQIQQSRFQAGMIIDVSRDLQNRFESVGGATLSNSKRGCNMMFSPSERKNILVMD